MVFSGIPFLFYFLPIILIIYFAVPFRFKNAALLAGSLVFYAWGEPRFCGVLVLTVVIGYAAGLGIEHFRSRRMSGIILAAFVVFCLMILGYCKYADFFISNLNMLPGVEIPLINMVLPVGISFYTFQIISYAVDVYRGRTEAQKNIIDLGTYTAMFPQLAAGPIVRYGDIAGQLKFRTHTMDKASEGCRRMAAGLAKKVLAANTLGSLCSAYTASNDRSLLFVWLYAAAASLQIYFDFSGYSDMAIGLGKIFGFTFPENFNYPYISRSITEFWRRWHISLGAWFRDYVYIPMGGNRVSKLAWIFNIFTVWILTGLWHGAAWNFALWGLYFAVLLIIEKLFLKNFLERHRIVSHIYVIFTVIISFMIFNGADIGAMFGAAGLPAVSTEAIYYLRSYSAVLVLGIILSTPAVPVLSSLMRASDKGRKIFDGAEIIIIAVMLLFVTAALVNGSYNPFLYFRF